MTQMGERSDEREPSNGPGQRVERLWIVDPNGTEITAPRTVIVGNRVQLRVTGTSSVSDPRWTIASSAVAGYRQELTRGVVTALDASARRRGSVAFHFIRGGSETVRVTGRVGGVQRSATAQFTVLRPTVSGFRLHTSSVNVFEANFFAGSSVAQPGTWLAAREHAPPDLGLIGVDAPRQIAGARWSAQVTAPAGGAGHVGFVQLINTHRVWRQNDGTLEFRTSNDEYVLDSGGYGPQARRIQFALGGSDGAGPDRIGASEAITVRMEDSPGHTMSSASSETAGEDRFRVYLVYKSSEPDSIWVTLQRRDWSWAGRTTRRYGSWTRPAAPAWMSPHPYGNGMDSTELPSWTQSTSGLAGQHEESGRGMWERARAPSGGGGCSVVAPGR